jgi:hypothetical protein
VFPAPMRETLCSHVQPQFLATKLHKLFFSLLATHCANVEHAGNSPVRSLENEEAVSYWLSAVGQKSRSRLPSGTSVRVQVTCVAEVPYGKRDLLDPVRACNPFAFHGAPLIQFATGIDLAPNNVPLRRILSHPRGAKHRISPHCHLVTRDRPLGCPREVRRIRGVGQNSQGVRRYSILSGSSFSCEH